MLKSLIIAITSIVVLMTAWLMVQVLWKRTFQEYIHDDDVLAERRSCKNCGCTKACPNKEKVLENE